MECIASSTYTREKRFHGIQFQKPIFDVAITGKVQ